MKIHPLLKSEKLQTVAISIAAPTLVYFSGAIKSLTILPLISMKQSLGLTSVNLVGIYLGNLASTNLSEKEESKYKKIVHISIVITTILTLNILISSNTLRPLIKRSITPSFQSALLNGVLTSFFYYILHQKPADSHSKKPKTSRIGRRTDKNKIQAEKCAAAAEKRARYAAAENKRKPC